jgi:acyl carrier protein
MIKESVRNFLQREFFRNDAVDTLSEDQPLVTSGILDSVATLKLVLFLEETFGIIIDTADIADGRLDTMTSIEALVTERHSS